MMQALLKEPRGREHFVHRYTTHMQTTLSRARLLRVIDNKQAILAPEMERHIARWQPTENSNPQSALPLRNSGDWLAEVQVLRDYAEARHEHVWADLQTSFKLGEPATLQVGDVPGLLGVEVEGLALPRRGGDRAARFFTRLPMQLSLRLAKGWRLAGWGNNIGPGDDGRFILTGDTTLRPQLVFEPAHRPMFQSIELEQGDRLRLVFFGIAGRTHHVEASADLADWQRLKTIAVPGSESQSIAVPLGNEPGRRFFRIVSDPE
jgi:hypothetical protein